MTLSEIIVFCYGDSNKLSTWSNVPYLFTTTLENKGIVVHRVDITPPAFFRKWYNAIIWRFSRLLFRGTQSNDLRSWICQQIIEKKIKSAVLQFDKADCCFFFGFDYYNRYNSIPTVLLGDWSFDLYLRDHIHKQNVDPLERRFIRQQLSAIRSAHLVISLFSDAARHIQMTVPEANVHYLDRNVINNASHTFFSEQFILNLKCHSSKLLFIGRENYLEGAHLLIDAFQILNYTLGPQYSLHIIGLPKNAVDRSCLNNVHFYGYLDKSDAEDNAIYYSLLSEAKLIINPTPGWAGYSSIIEAMYYYTPIIISPFLAFKEEFGENLPFGQYFIEKTPDSLAHCIQKLINSPHYLEQCKAAHSAVKDYSWDAYIDALIQLL